MHTHSLRICLLIICGVLAPTVSDGAQSSVSPLDAATQAHCLDVLRAGLASDEFWPSIHAAEGLTLAGHGDDVIRSLEPKMRAEQDDQHRCGIARELVRAGQRQYTQVLLEIAGSDDDYGHVHAAESLYKVGAIGDGRYVRRAFSQSGNITLKLMAAGALARCGNPRARMYLREMLETEEASQYRIAAWILGRIGDPSDITRIASQLNRCPDDVTRAYLNHSLAALGSSAGRSALLLNLDSDDPAIRTYAATFAGDGRIIAAAPRLRSMLEDSHPDARYRAAQSLLWMARPAPTQSNEDISNIVFASTPQNPRYTEGSVIERHDGSLLFAITEFRDSDSDFAKARIVARSSADGGRTWQPSRVLQENTGGLNVMSVTLRRVEADCIGLFYLQKNDYNDLDLFVRFSNDEAATFGPAILVTGDPGYHVVNNDRITRLSTGRLLAPAASTPDVKTDNHFVSHCYLSDDAGQTWRPGRGHVDADKRGAMEPEVIELRDGRILMIVRTQLGIIGRSESNDGGDTWSKMSSLGVTAPEAPATLRRIPATGDLLLVWNNAFSESVGHGGRRTPLTAAVSRDEGLTWAHVRNLENDQQRTYSYASLIFVNDRAVLSYWDAPQTGGYAARIRSLPVSWFYAVH